MILRREKSSPIYPQAPLSVILTDLSALHAWHHATPGISSRYAETEVLHQTGLSDASLFASILSDYVDTDKERAEYYNYLSFDALKKELSNWPTATSAQIDELQRIAEARTGRSSVMAQGVLCFFFNLCAEYFYETYGDPADQMRSIMLTPSADEGNSSVTVSPNPTDGALRIESDNILSIVEIYDSFGKLMLTEQCDGPFCLLDISTLNAGMYLLKVRLDNGTVTNCKVMKK